jgi:predicted transcriptional regulator
MNANTDDLGANLARMLTMDAVAKVQNHLSLTQDDIDGLKGMAQAEIARVLHSLDLEQNELTAKLEALQESNRFPLSARLLSSLKNIREVQP